MLGGNSCIELLRLFSLFSLVAFRYAAIDFLTQLIQENASDSIFEKNVSYFIMVIDKLGLANRLRVIAGGYLLSQRAKRSLIILWAPSNECNASFRDLFESNASWGNIYDIYPESHRSIYLSIESAASKSGLVVSSIYPTDFGINMSAYTDILEKLTASAELTFIWTLGVHAPIDIDSSQYMQMKATFYKTLVPIRHVRYIALI
jgi:hypothetical protein